LRESAAAVARKDQGRKIKNLRNRERRFMRRLQKVSLTNKLTIF
jgi:hypothetical protein